MEQRPGDEDIYKKMQSILRGILIIILAILVFYMKRIVPLNYVVQAQLVTVGIMGFLLIYDWKKLYSDWKNRQGRN
jgi:hypothetical protein